MWYTLIKSWKTTLCGAAIAGLTAVGTINGNLTWKQACTGFLIAAIGFLSKDHNVTTR